MAARSCSDRLASRFSVILLFSGESPLGRSSALELSMLGLVSVMSSLLAVGRQGLGSSWTPKDTPLYHVDNGEPWASQVLTLCLEAQGQASAWAGAAPKAFRPLFFPKSRAWALALGCCLWGHEGTMTVSL